MSKKIQDIKKKEAQHVDVEQETTEETHISVHTDTEKDAVKKMTEEKKESINSIEEKVEDRTEVETAVMEKEPVPKKKMENDPSEKNEESALKDELKKTKESTEKKIDEIRVIFMGTGDFAASILREISNDPHVKIKEIVTQPDKKIGRKKSSIHRTLAPNPVRDIAKENATPLFQPTKIDKEAISHMKKSVPDMIVVASYGKILPKELLDMPKFGAINIHTSLLPKLRGASPVQNALLLGLEETGVTIMQMDEGLDTGDILAQKSTPIEEHEKTDELLMRLSKLATDLLFEVGPKILKNEITPQPQDHSKATLCQLIDREDGHVQWTQTTQEIYNRYRALYPWPGIFSYWEEKENQMMRLKLRSVYPYTRDLSDEEKELQPGTVFIGHDQLCIKTFDGALIIEALQPECKVVMPIYDFLNGHKTFEGSVLR